MILSPLPKNCAVMNRKRFGQLLNYWGRVKDWMTPKVYFIKSSSQERPPTKHKCGREPSNKKNGSANSANLGYIYIYNACAVSIWVADDISLFRVEVPNSSTRFCAKSCWMLLIYTSPQSEPKGRFSTLTQDPTGFVSLPEVARISIGNSKIYIYTIYIV